MTRREFLRDASQAGLLVSASSFIGEVATAEPYANFHALPIYRAYVRGVQYRGFPPDYLDQIEVPTPLDLLREPDNAYDKRAIAVYHYGVKLGYLPREDNLVLSKLIRRGLPVVCRLIGLQPQLETYKQLSIEVALLYPPHPSTDTALEQSESDRLQGLERISRKPHHTRRDTSDPLSAGHVYAGYYQPHAPDVTLNERRAQSLRSFLGSDS